MSTKDEPLGLVAGISVDPGDPLDGLHGHDVYTATAASYNRAADKYAMAHSSTAEIEDILEAFASALPVPSTILDSGCGHGRDAAFFASYGHAVIGVDYSANLLRIASRAVPAARFAAADVRSLPLVGRTFDGVWMNAVVHHLLPADVGRCLVEIRRVLRPNGLVYLSSHLNREPGWDHKYEGAPRYYSGMTRAALIEVLLRHGFTIQKIFDRQGEDSWLHIFMKDSAAC